MDLFFTLIYSSVIAFKDKPKCTEKIHKSFRSNNTYTKDYPDSFAIEDFTLLLFSRLKATLIDFGKNVIRG